MNCDQCQLILEEYLDGELDSQVAEMVSLHLQACSGCDEGWQHLRTEFEILSSARIDLDPSAGVLWSGVSAQLNGESKLGRFPSWWNRMFSVPRLSVPAAVAIVILTVVTTVVFMKQLSLRPSPNTEISKLSKPAVPNHESSPPLTIDRATNEPNKPRQKTKSYAARNRKSLQNDTPDQLVREAQQRYVAAIELLSRDVARNRSSLDSATRLRLEESLTSIDRTIAATERAVRRSPDDPVAVQYMLAAYAKKVDVLREMANGGRF
jgi:hypothetical protein